MILPFPDGTLSVSCGMWPKGGSLRDSHRCAYHRFTTRWVELHPPCRRPRSAQVESRQGVSRHEASPDCPRVRTHTIRTRGRRTGGDARPGWTLRRRYRALFAGIVGAPHSLKRQLLLIPVRRLAHRPTLEPGELPCAVEIDRCNTNNSRKQSAMPGDHPPPPRPRSASAKVHSGSGQPFPDLVHPLPYPRPHFA